MNNLETSRKVGTFNGFKMVIFTRKKRVGKYRRNKVN